ncbi:MAG: aspartate-semialdehyde dehydrogenase [Fusobacterium sp.]|uniref:aspartate-semialdehyde dehydrogenase n=1 Tax=Fusobacterium sp. TaxID=68766 RepID=UPI0026DB7B6C|nr:aspartate-semialdehyde dehydrogenase [Fusobacterium sp.]MDO4689938.1 aspartate-semialdehyde dehydrogenase [Fusobacterium sp.]
MKIAILGATGAVGQQMLSCLVEQNIPVTELKLLASARSIGKKYMFKGREIVVEEAKENSFEGLDIVLGAVESDMSKKFAPSIKKAGAVYIDNSSAFRLDEDVPLVVPEINAKDALKHKGIIANPNCSTIIAMMAIYGVNKISKITDIIASTYQAVSGAGVNGIYELENQVQDILNNREVKTDVFSHQIAYNCIPKISEILSNDYTAEEMKMQNEGRKILHNPDLKVTCTCVRVPVIRSHSISLSFRTEKKLTKQEITEAIKNSAGVKLVDLPNLPLPLNTSDTDIVEVGRIRRDEVLDGFALWCCGDQVRKGAATNAVQIIKCLNI